jgi:hypothetical protein
MKLSGQKQRRVACTGYAPHGSGALLAFDFRVACRVGFEKALVVTQLLLPETLCVPLGFRTSYPPLCPALEGHDGYPGCAPGEEARR